VKGVLGHLEKERTQFVWTEVLVLQATQVVELDQVFVVNQPVLATALKMSCVEFMSI
jgi:hypothetical protein